MSFIYLLVAILTTTACNSSGSSAATPIGSSVSLTSINPSSGTASGEAGFTLTGTNLLGATSVSFDGVPATSINVLDSTTLTGVSPAHAIGAVDISVTTPSGSASLTAGYTYLTTAVGQISGGGLIACLGGGLQNIIAASVDNSSNISWGGMGTTTNAQSNTDGATNSATIFTALGAGSYAANLCLDYEVDSQGNTPCEPGNTCYNDWYLPAINQLGCFYTNRVAIGGFATDDYWSSTEFSVSAAFGARFQSFATGISIDGPKTDVFRARCARAFVP